jgi:hypothetical protein
MKNLMALAVMLLTLNSGIGKAAPKLVLLEVQLNTSCFNSYGADSTVNSLTDCYSEYFIPIVYHSWFPGTDDPFYNYNSAANYARISYYPAHYDGFYHTPYAWVDGVIRGGTDFDQWGNEIIDRHEVEAPLEINLNGYFDSIDRSGALTVSLAATQDITANRLRLRTALTEDSIFYEASNGTCRHNFVMREMVPDAYGTPIELSQYDTLTMQVGFNCPEPLDAGNCRLIVWVQADDNSHKILQAAGIKLNQLRPVAVDYEIRSPRDFYLSQNYPNPFNAQTRIEYSLASPSQVNLEIYDILGRRIETLVNEIQQPGVQSVIWDAEDMPSGIYFYRIQAGGCIETKKMNLMK